MEWNSECHFKSSMSTNTTVPILLQLYQPQLIATSFKFALFVCEEGKSEFVYEFGYKLLGESTFPGKRESGKLRRNTKLPRFSKWEFPQ